MAQGVARRGFHALAVIGLTLCALTAVPGCGGSDGPDTVYADKTAKVYNNHGHTFVLTAAEQEAGQPVTIRNTGGGHQHKLYLTQENLAAVAAGTTWAKESSLTLGHSHIVQFNP